ncbi:MAG: hypothetical protein DMG65_15700 [Candidatus Angelobacter sp. Gp1-AA117]|nr:MAG: hypothetical protein DMG65_15700 [Candidatus Angelobacter sp. Gp1-AA117]
MPVLKSRLLHSDRRPQLQRRQQSRRVAPARCKLDSSTRLIAPAPGSRLRFGVGLTNVRSRLKQLYGDQSSLELNGGDGRGCEAIITIPLRSSH